MSLAILFNVLCSQKQPYFGTLRETGREEDRETAGEDIGNQGSG